MQRTQIYITEDDSKALKHRAIDLNISLSELLRCLIKVYLENPRNEIFKTDKRENNSPIQGGE